MKGKPLKKYRSHENYGRPNYGNNYGRPHHSHSHSHEHRKPVIIYTPNGPIVYSPYRPWPYGK